MVLYAQNTISRTRVYVEQCKNVLCDVVAISRSIISRDTLKIIVCSVPAYTIIRQFDKPVHRHFYAKKKHKNIRQLPACLNHVPSAIVAASLVTGSLLFFSHHDHVHTAARIFLIGLPLTGITKQLLKLLRADFCLRPPNGDYKKCAYYGGFPSGHMTEMIYITTLYALEFGAWALPFALGAGYIGIDFVVRNRHYCSQLVAGAVLGAVWAVAASKVVHGKRYKNFSCAVNTSADGKSISLEGSYNF
jgi:membrane-associated phospholipid phosphatase